MRPAKGPDDGDDATLDKGSADQVEVAEKDEEAQEIPYIPTREEMAEEEHQLLEASGAFLLQKKEEAYQERRKWREQNPSMLDKWEQDMEEVRMDTQRRKLWGDLKKRSGERERFRGKKKGEKVLEMRYNRGFPVVEEDDDDDDGAEEDKRWIDVWRSTWPAEEAIDPHDPESFGFSWIGEITGSHGLLGDVRVRVDDFLCEKGYDPAEHLSHRNFSNWTAKSKRIHLKAKHRRFPRPFKIITGKRVQRRVYALRLKGVNSIEEAMQMRGMQVYALDPPPGYGAEKPGSDPEFNGVDLYDANTTTFHTHDALELVGAKCVMLKGWSKMDEEVLGQFALAETPQQAQEVLADTDVEAMPIGEISAVVPDYKIATRHKARKAAHDLLDITLLPNIKVGEDRYLFESHPNSPRAKLVGEPELFQYANTDYEQVCYVPFVPDMIARVDADHSGVTVYFTLPDKHLESASFTCRKRFVDEKGLLAIPRGPSYKAMLPPAGKSHALRRAGKRRPLHGTAPAPPADMPVPAGIPFPETPPGVPRPPLNKSEAWK